MTKRSIHFGNLLGPGVVPESAPSFGWVDVAPAYAFVDGDAINWPVPKRFFFVAGELTVAGVEDTYLGEPLVWAFSVGFKDAHAILGSFTATKTFPAGAGMVEYSAMLEVDPVELPGYGPTWAAQAAAAAAAAAVSAAAAETARVEAEAFGGTNNAQVAGFVTTAGATQTALNATIATQVALTADGWLTEVFRGRNQITYGHSFLAETGLTSVAQYWARRFAAMFGMVYPTSAGGTTNDLKRAVGGSETNDATELAIGATAAGWVAGTPAVVVVEALINSARLYGEDDVLGREFVRNSLRTLAALLSASERVEVDTSGAFTYSGTWATSSSGLPSGGSWRTTTAAAAYVEYTIPADGLDRYVLLVGKPDAPGDGPVATITDQTNGGVTVSVTDLAQRAKTGDITWVPVFLPNSLGGHVIRITKTNAVASSLAVDAILPQALNPNLILMMKEPYLVDYSLSVLFPNGSDLALDQFNAIIDEIAVEWANVAVADPNAQGYWQKDVAYLQTDGVHPSVLGNEALALTARDALKAYALRRAILSAVRTVTPATDTTAPTVPTSLNATPGPGTADLAWAASTDFVGVTGYRIFQDGVAIGTVPGTSTTITGLTGGVLYSFTVTAFDLAANESAQSTADTVTPTTPPTVYAADTFTRADSATCGNTETGGFAWTANPVGDQSKWDINTNRLRKTAVAATSPKELLVDSGQADGTVKVTLVSALTSSQGLALRVAADGASGLMFDRGTDGVYRIRSRAGATYTTLYTSSAVGAAGDVIEVVLAGSSVTLKVNGTTLGAVTSTVNQTATRHGFYAGSNPIASFDDFSHTA